jgi:folate-binding protein YgfZ
VTATIEAAAVPRSFLRVRGGEAEQFLQGQLSQDIAHLPALSFLLDPTGKVVALVRAVRDGDTFVLDTDRAAGEAVRTRLQRFLLRVDVQLEPVEGWECVRVWGAPRLPQATTATVWAGGAAPQELIGTGVENEVESLGARWLDPAEAERRRIAAGVPVSGVDIGPQTIPGEVGAWAIDRAVSFTKGCFTGQELVARIDSRGGNVPRPLRVLTATTADELHAPADVVRDGKVVGQITSAAFEVALGAVARSVGAGAEVRVVWDGGEAPARVEADSR